MIKLISILKEIELDDVYQNRKNININGTEYTFSRLKTYGEENVFVIELNDKEIGRATLNTPGNFLDNIRIDHEYRRKGLASALYDYIESIITAPLNPSPIKQSPEIKHYWRKRMN